jgi:serine/threonine-protein kinase
MPVTSGTRFGSYEILSLLGAGGMGEVYRAHDAKLGRTIAIKVLPDALASDPDRLARFEREAKVLASLSHPHIAALYGFEEAEGRHLLVMELVEGETLAERLMRGPMTVDDALESAQQIADALESAHEKGIVHRDLKPANVKLTPDGRVKVLDFGLARLPEKDQPAASVNATNSPTLNALATQAGVILGTAGYMSPEQAKGALADHRSDMFSFGTVLYEMLTGRRAFHAETAAETMAAVLMKEPDFGALPPDVNPRITALLRRCLDKSPRRRWQAAGDLRAEIETIRTTPQMLPVSQGPALRPLWRRALPLVVCAAVSAAIAGGLVWRAATPTTRPAVVRFSIVGEGLPVGTPNFRTVSISPDGARIVFGDGDRLYLREMSSADVVPVAIAKQTLVGGATFSPDGKSIAFVSGFDRLLKRVAIGGGQVTALAPIEVPSSVSWETDDILLTLSNRIMRIRPDGGAPDTIITMAAGENASGARMLPDGRHVLFTVLKGTGDDGWNSAEVVVQELGSGSRKTIVEGGSARYLPSGDLVYSVGGVLFAAPFDLSGLALTGAPTRTVEGVARNGTVGALFEVSRNGSLVYIPGPATLTSAPAISDLVVTNGSGQVDVLKLTPGAFQTPRISPDGTRVAYVAIEGQANIWVYDLDARTAPRRLTFGGNNRHPLWSADGRYLVFQSDREGDLGIFRQLADVTGTAVERLTKPAMGTAHIPESWSRKDDLFLFSALDGPAATLWSYSVRDKTPAQVGNIRSSSALNAELSPDGRWIAYTLRGGEVTTAINIEPFPPTGERRQISSAADLAHHAVWSPDAGTLFFIPGAQPLVGVSVTHQPTLAVGDPHVWPGKLPNNTPFGAPRNFDIFPDGKRFIAPRFQNAQASRTGSPAPQVEVVVNWLEEFRARQTTSH